MANISSSWGEITIKAKNKKYIQALVFLMQERLSSVTYETNLTEFECSPNISVEERMDIIFNKTSEKIKEKNGEFILTTSFTGTGCWSYMNNIEAFTHWISEKGEKEEELVEEIYQEIKEEELIIIFNFTDTESGAQFLMQREVEVDVKTQTVNVLDDISYPYTAQYLMNVAGYDFPVDLDENGFRQILEVLKDHDEHLNQIIKNHHDAILQRLLEQYPNVYTITDIWDAIYALDIEDIVKEFDDSVI